MQIPPTVAAYRRRRTRSSAQATMFHISILHGSSTVMSDVVVADTLIAPS
jgi:hypothetical protein